MADLLREGVLERFRCYCWIVCAIDPAAGHCNLGACVPDDEDSIALDTAGYGEGNTGDLAVIQQSLDGVVGLSLFVETRVDFDGGHTEFRYLASTLHTVRDTDQVGGDLLAMLLTCFDGALDCGIACGTENGDDVRSRRKGDVCFEGPCIRGLEIGEDLLVRMCDLNRRDRA